MNKRDVISMNLEGKCCYVPSGGGGGGGVLPYMGYIGMCGPKEYGFQPFWS